MEFVLVVSKARVPSKITQGKVRLLLNIFNNTYVGQVINNWPIQVRKDSILITLTLKSSPSIEWIYIDDGINKTILIE